MEERNKFAYDKTFLRFMMYQDSIYLPPYYCCYIREIQNCNPSYKNNLAKCPPDMLPCEITSNYTGNFIFISKDKWIKNKIFTDEDIRVYD